MAKDDLELARAVTLRPIGAIAEGLGLAAAGAPNRIILIGPNHMRDTCHFRRRSLAPIASRRGLPS